MLLKKLSVGGWRSFAPQHPVEFDNLGIVNLLIGPNNVGKSNAGRFLVRLRDLLSSFRDEAAWSTGRSFSEPLGISFAAEEADHWLRDGVAIEAEVQVYADALGSPEPLPTWLANEGVVRVAVRLAKNGGNGILTVSPLASDGRPIIAFQGASYKLLSEDGTYTERVTGAHAYRGIAHAVCRTLARGVSEIRPLRDPTRETASKAGLSTDGGDIIEALRKRQADRNGQAFWTECIGDLENWFGTLLGERELRIHINETGFWIEVRRGVRKLRSALSDLGAGVSEILMVLAYLRLHPNERFLVVVDEPEAHLHPGAVVELARIITANMPKHQLMVTTHSTALLDAVSPAWKTFRVRRAKHDGTAVEALDTGVAELALLADLGVRPSQLFLSRVAIWVEGPSDVHYWTALLREVDPQLVVGRDFAFVTYGGASAAHLGFVSDDESEVDGVDRLVRVLKVSHRAVIACDRDRATSADGEVPLAVEIEQRPVCDYAASLLPSTGCLSFASWSRSAATSFGMSA